MEFEKEDSVSSWTISSPCYDMATSQKIYKYLANQKDLTIRLKINIGGFGTYYIIKLHKIYLKLGDISHL